MTLYSKIVKPVWGRIKAPNWRSYLLCVFLFSLSIFLPGFMFSSLYFIDNIFNETLGIVCMICGYFLALNAEFVAVFQLKFKHRLIKIFYYILMFILCEIPCCISLYLLWSFALPAYEVTIMSVWMIPLTIALIYTIIFHSTLFNVLNHLMLIYHAINGSEENYLKCIAPFRAFLCIISVISLFGSLIFLFHVHMCFYLCCQFIFGFYVFISASFLSIGKEAEIQSRLVNFIHSIKSAIHPCYLFIPLIFGFVKFISEEIYKLLTVSEIALKGKCENCEARADNPYEHFFAVLMFLAIYSSVRDVWLKLIIEKDLYHNFVSFFKCFSGSSEKIETDV